MRLCTWHLVASWLPAKDRERIESCHDKESRVQSIIDHLIKSWIPYLPYSLNQNRPHTYLFTACACHLFLLKKEHVLIEEKRGRHVRNSQGAGKDEETGGNGGGGAG